LSRGKEKRGQLQGKKSRSLTLCWWGGGKQVSGQCGGKKKAAGIVEFRDKRAISVREEFLGVTEIDGIRSRKYASIGLSCWNWIAGKKS